MKVRDQKKGYSVCRLCPHECAVDRTAGERGVCGARDHAIVASAQLHFGEERVLVGRGGSGTIFFAGCNLHCCFCQNCDISMLEKPEHAGREVGTEELLRLILLLRDRGAENINFVTPTHFLPSIADALSCARDEGLEVPVVYNCGGYERPEMLRELEGLVDIYMPDFKFGSDAAGARYTEARDYFSRCREALAEMYRQTGELQFDPRGTANRGLLVRHLVLPNDMAESRKVIETLAAEISEETYLHLMDQFSPACKARGFSELRRRVTMDEMEQLRRYAAEVGLHRVPPHP